MGVDPHRKAAGPDRGLKGRVWDWVFEQGHPALLPVRGSGELW